MLRSVFIDPARFMSLNFVPSFYSLCRYSYVISRSFSARGWLLRLRYLRAGLRHRKAVGPLLASESAGAFRDEVKKNPDLMGFFLWPFLNASWPVEKRFDHLVRHYDLLGRHFPWLRLGYKQALSVLDVSDMHPGLYFVLEDAPWFLREGCINFSMMCEGDRLMSVSFALAECDGQIQALVGSIQGSALPTALETYKSIAESMQDTRPRDLHFKVFRLLLQCIGVGKVLCVADECRAHTDPFFGSGKEDRIKLRYDELWADQGGVLNDEGFYTMPAAMEDRPISDVPTKKRGRYKRRLEMFSHIRKRLEQSVATAGNAVKV